MQMICQILCDMFIAGIKNIASKRYIAVCVVDDDSFIIITSDYYLLILLLIITVGLVIIIVIMIVIINKSIYAKQNQLDFQTNVDAVRVYEWSDHCGRRNGKYLLMLPNVTLWLFQLSRCFTKLYARHNQSYMGRRTSFLGSDFATRPQI